MTAGRRRFIQLACFLVAGALLWPLPFWITAPKFVVQASPFVAACEGAALRSLGVGTAIGIGVAALGIFCRRWFCRYACPMGLLLDAVSHAGLRKTLWWNRCVPVGKYAAILTIAGAAVGYPVLLWMDPLAILSNAFSIRAAASAVAGILAGFGLSALILLSFASGSLWCSRLCPLGGALDLLADAGSLFRGRGRIAQEAPPVPMLRHASGCRRSFLLILAGAGLGLCSRRLGAARGEDAPLRPPGAVNEAEFAGLCVRCGNCVRLCPAAIIHMDTGQGGALGVLAPILRYESNYCLEECRDCTRVCPSGALQVLDLKAKREYAIGEALLNASLCVLALGERDCDACVPACPYNAVRIHWDEDLYMAYPVVDRQKCNGCGACEVACPVPEVKAIRVWKRAS